MKPLADCRLYAFVDTSYLRDRSPALVAQQLCDGGADLIQLRAKKSTLEQVRTMAEGVLPVVRRAGVGLVINDFPSVADELGADFCHLGQEDFFGQGCTNVSQVLARAPSREHASVPLGIGLSTHTPVQARRAIAAGADYVGIGPVYPTGTKPMAKAVTLDYVRWAAANVPVPWFAIGGISLQRIDEVLEAGATRICVVSAILNAEDVAGECRKFARALARASGAS